MFGLFYLAIILIYVFASILLSKLIKNGNTSALIYWFIVFFIPVWFFAGHYLYPSYFEYKSLCQTQTINTYSYERNIEPLSEKVWLVPNRLFKKRIVDVDDSGTVTHEQVYFSYYPYGTKASLLSGSSGSAPRQSCNSKNNLTEFIKKHINIVPLKQQVIMQDAEVISDLDPFDRTNVERGRSGDIVWCASKVVGEGYNDTPGLGVSYLLKETPIERKHSIEKTICTNEYIYIVKTPSKGNEYIEIYTYDYQGINLDNLKYPVPSRVWTGYPRKPLRYFDVNHNQMVIGIEEFGRDMKPEIVYYNLQLNNSNN